MKTGGEKILFFMDFTLYFLGEIRYNCGKTAYKENGRGTEALSMVKNIVFDMGQVLLSHIPQRYLHKIFTDETAIQAIDKGVFGSPEWTMLDEGVLTEEEALCRWKQALPQYTKEIDTAFASWHTDLLPIEGMVDLLRQLKEKGYRLYLLSNMHLRFYDFSDKVEAFRYLDGILISSKERMKKPEPRIYRRFCEKFSVKPQECLFVDDKPENIAAAEQEGFSGHVFTTPEKLREYLQEQGIL